MALKVIARLVARGIKHIIDHKASSTLIILLTIALIFVSTAKFSEPQGAQASQVSQAAAPATTEQYFKGQMNFNSAQIWETLSPELIRRAEASGATQQDLQDQLDRAREMGRRVKDVVYIGGYNLENGNSMQFYVVTVSDSATDDTVDQIFYVFTLDKDGKILSIE